jgi:WS/DGAT/MGAT family acyltransferase
MSTPVPAPDAFFLHVESAVAAQQVGGLVLLDTGVNQLTRQGVEGVLRARLHRLPRFRQRLETTPRWRRPRWRQVDRVDWAWHLPVCRPPPPGGGGGLHRLVAELQATPLPRDRPLWRMVLVPEVEPGLAAAVLVVHHAVGDGVGVVQQALRLLDPVVPQDPVVRWVGAAAPRRPVAAALRVARGLVQLATDGGVRWRLPGGTASTATPARRFVTLCLPLAELRTVGRRHRARVSDVLLSVIAGGLQRLRPDLAGTVPLLRTLVPLTLRHPAAPAEANITAGIFLDLPLQPMPEPERLARVVRCRRRRGTGGRAAASRFVVQTVGTLLPPPAYAWFARTVYGGRYFQAIVTNIPGPGVPLHLTGVPVRSAFPIVPLSPGAPLAVGALGWNDVLHLGVTADPALCDDLEPFGAAVRAVLDGLA